MSNSRGGRDSVGILLEVQFVEKHLRQIVGRRSRTVLLAILGVVCQNLTVPIYTMLNRFWLLFEFRQKELLRVLPFLILFHRTLQRNPLGGNIVLSRGYTIEEAYGFTGIDGDLASRSFQRMEAFES